MRAEVICVQCMKRQMEMRSAHALTDLNLLTTLRHLLATGSVTATAERLGLSQPAVSRALGRLRASLGDELLVRGKGGLLPTHRALTLAPELELLLSRLDDLLASGAGFDPATSRRTFVVASGDYAASALLPRLLEVLAARAPGVTVRVVPTVPEAEEALESGAWDVLWSPRRKLSGAVVWTKLFDESFAFVLSKRHPLAAKPLTLERFLSIRQLAIAPEGRPGNPLDEMLARQGHRREVVAHLPNFTLVPGLVAQSELGAVLPRRIIEESAVQLVIKPLPFALPGFSLQQAWHHRQRHDAGHAWFRRTVAELQRS